MIDIASIFIEIDDELTDVLEKVSASRYTKLFIHIPARSLLLTSGINLALIKKKGDNEKKELIILTRDNLGRTLAEKAGMRAFKDQQEAEAFYFEEYKHKGITIEAAKPDIKAEKQPDTPESPKNHMPESFLGRISYLVSGKQTEEAVAAKKEKKETRKDEEAMAPYRVTLMKPSKKAFVTILVVSVFTLVTIIFFALPDATIRIQPKLVSKDVGINVILSETKSASSERSVIITPLEATYEKQVEYPATGETFTGQSARGVVRMYNRSTEERSIVGNTRLQTESGLVFLTQRFVKIPRGSGNRPGTVDVEVVAREKDASEKFVGDRGNIGPSKFFLPALTGESQRIIYAESVSPMTGGVTGVKRFITKDDIDNANKNIVMELENLAPDRLKATLDGKKLEAGPDLDVFSPTNKKFVTKELLEAQVPTNLIGQEADNFKVYGKMKAKGWYYNKKDIVSILEDYVKNHQLTFNQELLAMDLSTFKFTDEVLVKQGEIKVTAEMKALVSYSFSNDTDNLISEIKKTSVGKEKSKAISEIQNHPDIDNVEIRLSPWWQQTLPAIKENIKIQIVQPTVGK